MPFPPFTFPVSFPSSLGLKDNVLPYPSLTFLSLTHQAGSEGTSLPSPSLTFNQSGFEGSLNFPSLTFPRLPHVSVRGSCFTFSFPYLSLLPQQLWRVAASAHHRDLRSLENEGHLDIWGGSGSHAKVS